MTTRYILLYRDVNGEKCRIDFSNPRQLDDIGDVVLFPPIKLYKKLDDVKVNGGCRYEGLDKMITSYKKGITLIRQINYNVCSINVIRLITKASFRVYPYMSSEALKLAFGGIQKEIDCHGTKIILSKDNFIHVRCLHWIRPHLLAVLGLNVQE